MSLYDSVIPHALPDAPASGSVEAPATKEGLLSGMFARVLDEVDHGLILLDPSGHIVHANHAARRELALGRFLQRQADDQLQACALHAQAQLHHAWNEALRDARSIVELEHGDETLTLAFIPLGSRPASARIDHVLIILSRTDAVQSLTLQMFARARGLTTTEQSVLGQLCAGRHAEQIAEQQGVQVSTVRTHIKNMRQKTGAGSIGEMVQRVSRLPQIVSTLRVVSTRR